MFVFLLAPAVVTPVWNEVQTEVNGGTVIQLISFDVLPPV